MAAPLVPLPTGVTIQQLVRMPAMEIIVTYGKDVYDLIARLERGGSVVRDGRSNADLAIQAEVREKIALEGDCGPADLYKAELAEQRLRKEEEAER